MLVIFRNITISMIVFGRFLKKHPAIQGWTAGVVGLLIVSIVGLNCGQFYPLTEISQTRVAIGTQVTITVLARTQQQGAALLHSAFAEIDRLEAIYSDRQPDSELGMINAGGNTKTVLVSREMADLLDRAFYWHGQTQGLFDVTVGTLQAAWGFKGGGPPTALSAQAIHELLPGTGMNKLKWDKLNRKLEFTVPGMHLDFGGIAKLEILLQLEKIFAARHCRHYLVDLGGDILAGEGKDGQNWTVGISDPRQPDQVMMPLKVKNVLVLSSGDYHRFFRQAGRTYQHILNPYTGYPMPAGKAVTLIMPRNQLQPMPSIVVFLLSREKGMQAIADAPGIQGLIWENGKAYISPGFDRYQ